jgi:hypothetical protein
MVVSAVAATLLVVTTLALAQPGPTFEPLPDPGTRREAPSEPAAITSQWTKLVDNVPWVQGLVVTAETSQTIQVVDVVTTLPADALWLVEKWNPQHLELNGYTVQPAGTSTVNTGDGSLTWELPEAGGVMTLTKTFHVKPCTWASTVLSETLSSSERLIEQRLVTINKEAPNLWIGSSYDSAVEPGQEASFTLSYGNNGGFENDVTIRNTFPAAAPFLSSNPPADDWAADGSWALWTIGELAKGAQGSIAVAVTIQPSAQPSSTIEIWDWIYDHTGEARGSTTISFHVKEPPRPEWLKLVDGVAWSSDLEVTAQTSDTIQVVDVVTTLPFAPLELVQMWNEEHLDLSEHTVEPDGSTIETGEGVLTWQLPESSGSFTLTKTFNVQPCTWTRTVLSETLSSGQG